jgi:hypothetical protein
LNRRLHGIGIIGLLVSSALCLALAPLALPSSYSWVVHTTSESAAQGVTGAWVARLGFLLLGFSVLWLAAFARQRWGRWGALCIGTFGVMMLGTAAFSHRPWLPELPFDRIEDRLHAFTATAMGFAFAAGVMAVGIARRGPSPLDRGADFVAVASSVVLPLAMAQGTPYTGVLQRTMFVVAYLWYAREATRAAL